MTGEFDGQPKKQEDAPLSTHPLVSLLAIKNLLLDQFLIEHALFAYNPHDINPLRDCVQIDAGFLLFRSELQQCPTIDIEDADIGDHRFRGYGHPSRSRIRIH